MSEPARLFSFVDDAARVTVAESLDETLVVEAGAGTGKTTALVQRVMSLLRSGDFELAQIAAITFTEAAARELRERIANELTSLSLSTDFAGEALSQLDESVITTIHGFAMRILSEHPLEAGLPLRFRVLDEVASLLRFERDCGLFLDEFFDNRNDLDLVAWVVAIGITPMHLRTLLRSMSDEANVFWADDESLLSPNAELCDLADIVRRHCEQLVSSLTEAIALAVHCTDTEDGLLARLRDLEMDVRAYEETADDHDRLSWLLGLAAQRTTRLGRAPSWTGCDIASVRSVLDEFEDLRGEAVRRTTHVVLNGLACHLLSTVRRWAADRRRDGEITFTDLLVLTYALLNSDLRIRSDVRERYPRILLDEFQDTDPLQLAILSLLSKASDDPSPDAGRLFFVGDPRQSIYRFRGARPEMYGERGRAELSAKTVRLTTNFRSVLGIVSFTNAIFDDIESRDAPNESPHDRLFAVALEPARGPSASTVPVVVLGGAKDDLRARERRAAESEDIAAAIAAMVGEEALIEDDATTRPLRFGDIAILVPRRTGLYELEAALERYDVPFHLESASLIYDASEVRDLLACLHAIDVSSDESALVAALRTPMFACGDDDLLDYHRSAGQWRTDVSSPPHLVNHPVANALGYLGDLSARSSDLGVLGSVRTLIEECSILELATARPNPREAIRRIEFVCEQARAFVDEGGDSIGELLAFFDLQRDQRVRGLDLPTGPADDAVHIMTIHGAKGLEFPAVVVAELGGTARGMTPSTRMLIGADGRFELRAGAGRETTGFAAAASEVARAEREERIRLCYVAMTRARDILILSLHHRPAASPRSRSLAEMIASSCEQFRGLWRFADFLTTTPSPIGSRQTSDDKDVERPSIAERNERFERLIAQRDRLVENVRRPTSIASSQLGHEGTVVTATTGPRSVVGIEQTDDLAFLLRREAASAVGRAVHSVLQIMGDNDEVLDVLSAQICADEGVSGRIDDVRSLVRAARLAPSVRDASSQQTAYRELPLTVMIEGRLLEAVIDLCYEKDGQLIVVDYKTDALSDVEAADQIAERYRLQAGAYALSLREVLGREVSKVVLVFLAMPGGAIEVPVRDLSLAVEEARSALLAATTPEFASFDV